MKNNKKYIENATGAIESVHEQIRNGEELHVSISEGNIKMGKIRSVSLLPLFTCPGCVKGTCDVKCYAIRMCHSSKGAGPIREAWARNTVLARVAPVRFWREVNAAVALSRFFRFHVGGDIPNSEYFCHMVDVAINNPHCEILAFTKRFEIVNKYIDKYGDLPKNLHVMFSGWKGLKPNNPHNLPETNVLFKGDELPDNWLMCGGNCSDCGCMGVGCWQAQKGQIIAFNEH